MTVRVQKQWSIEVPCQDGVTLSVSNELGVPSGDEGNERVRVRMMRQGGDEPLIGECVVEWDDLMDLLEELQGFQHED
jgi:hypothetical protein